jgi:hypothetical protein
VDDRHVALRLGSTFEELNRGVAMVFGMHFESLTQLVAGSDAEVRFRRYRFSATGELGCRGIRGAEG